MSTMKHHRLFWLLLVIISAVLSALAIPGIVFAALTRRLLLFFLCLALLIYAMYGMHFIYVFYLRADWVVKMLVAIERDGLRTATEISTTFCHEKEKVVRDLHACIRKGYLTGFSFDGEVLTKAAAPKDL